MDTFQNLGTPNRSRFGVFKLSKPKRLKTRHGLPDSVSEGPFVYRALSELDADGAWGTWLGEQRDASGVTRPVLLKHTGENNRTRSGADALWLEALLTLKLDGPQVVSLLDYGVLDGRPFAVYEFEEGVFLAQVIEGLRERGRKLPSGVAVGIILQACELVKRLHKVSLGDDAPGGFVHGSLCPRNFMLTERGDVKVMGLIGVRPVGRVVGREHVPPAAMAYASPDLLGGAPVTPAVDVFSLGAVLQELLGDDAGDAERDELGSIVRTLLRQGPAAGLSTVEAFAAALQDAVRRTGTVVARQSIGAQVRGVCEQYLLERRRQVRGLRETEWGDQREVQSARGASAAPAASPSAFSPSASSPSADELEVMEGAAEDEGAGLGEYDESSDDAVTRIYDGEELEQEGPGQPQAWMHDSRPAENARSGWSRWAVVTLLGVLVAVASGAAFMASRSVARTPTAVPMAEAKVAAASPGESRKAEPAPVAKPSPSSPAEGPSGSAALAAVRGSEPAGDDEGSAPAAGSAAAADDDEAKADDVAERGTSRRPVLRRVAAAPRRARERDPARNAKAGAPDRKPAPRAAEPATVAAADLPEASEEVETEEPAPAPPAQQAPRPAAAPGDGDLVIEEAPRMAFLSVDATPYATVFVDGEKKGITPLVRMELPPGLHRMIARTEDGRTKRFTLQLEPGKTETVKVSWEE
jgi:eukaryotic-like serine/threonine-protein kinase